MSMPCSASGLEHAGARAQRDVDLGVGRVRIVDHEPLLHAARRGCRRRSTSAARSGSRTACSRAHRARRSPLRPAPGRRTSRPSARPGLRADRGLGHDRVRPGPRTVTWVAVPVSARSVTTTSAGAVPTFAKVTCARTRAATRSAGPGRTTPCSTRRATRRARGRRSCSAAAGGGALDALPATSAADDQSRRATPRRGIVARSRADPRSDERLRTRRGRARLRGGGSTNRRPSPRGAAGSRTTAATAAIQSATSTTTQRRQLTCSRRSARAPARSRRARTRSSNRTRHDGRRSSRSRVATQCELAASDHSNVPGPIGLVGPAVRRDTDDAVGLGTDRGGLRIGAVDLHAGVARRHERVHRDPGVVVVDDAGVVDARQREVELSAERVADRASRRGRTRRSSGAARCTNTM